MNVDILNRLVRGEGSTSIRQRNILTPLLWLDGTFALGALALATRVSGAVQWFLLVLGALPAIVTLLAYGWFMFKDPNRLQSEEFQNTNRAISLISSQSGRTFSDAELAIITNPSAEPVRVLPAEASRE